MVLDATDITRALTRIAHEILERNKGARDLVLLGIPSRGVPLARRIAERISAVEGYAVPVGSFDITMYRDDLRLKPARTLLPTEIPAGGIDGRTVVLVDDVLFSGRIDPGRAGRAERHRPTRRPSSSRSWSTAATASCRSGPTSSARTCPPRWWSGCAVSLAGVDEFDAVTIEGGGRREAPPALGRRPDPRRRRAGPRPPPRRCARSPTGRSRSCRRCAGARWSTCSSRTPPAPGSPSRRPPSGSRPTSSTSPPRAPRSPRASRSRTPR